MTTKTWTETTIGEIAEIFDGPHATPKKIETGPTFLSISSLSNGRLNVSASAHLSEEHFVQWTRRVTPGVGDVVFSYETRLGEAALIPENLRCCLGRRMGLLRADRGKVDPRFLLYAYIGPEFQEELRKRIVHGATVDRILLTELGRFPIRIPDRPEQRAIAYILGTLDDKIELNRRMNETLEAMVRAIFKSWFVDFDPVRAKREGREPPSLSPELAALFPDSFEDSEMGEIPKGWRAGEVTDIQADMKNATGAGPFGSKLSRKHYSDDGVPVIRGANLVSGSNWFRENSFVFVPADYAETLKSSWATRGDVIFTQRGTLGQVGLIPPDSLYDLYIVSQSQMKLTCAPWMPPEYILLYFSQKTVVDYIKGNAVAAGVPHINLGFLRKFPLLIPSEECLGAYSTIIAPLVDRMRANQKETSSLSELRDSLLPRLLSGSLDLAPSALELNPE